MSTQDLTLRIILDQSPAEVFDAITNVRGWWSEEIEGSTEKQGDEFTYHFRDIHYCQMKLTEVIPNQRVVWLVKYNYFNFIKDKSEWMGTYISFDISTQDNKTLVTFIHHGLGPHLECYDICFNAWTTYITQSLYSLVTTGKGQPNSKENAVTADEQRLSAEADTAA